MTEGNGSEQPKRPPKIRRIDYSPDEYLAGIAGLTLQEQGLYWLICTLIYSTGRPELSLDDPRLRTLARCHGRTFEALAEKLEKTLKITRNGREISVKRCSNELEKALNRQAKWAENLAQHNETKDVDDPSAARVPPARRNPSTINHQPPPNGGTRAHPRASAATISPLATLAEGFARAIEKREREADRRNRDETAVPVLDGQRAGPDPGIDRT